MNNKTILISAITVSLCTGLGGGWWLSNNSNRTTSASTISGQPQRPILYWYDPMKPDAHFDQPGKSPFMDMDLVPRYADEEGSNTLGGIRIDPTLTQNTGVKYATVTRGTLNRTLEITGSIVFNDRDVAIIQSRTSGIVERAYPLAVGDVIPSGTPLADIRVPEWLAAQTEYLALRHNTTLANAARTRLLQLGMNQEQISTIERTGKPTPVITVTSPRSGMVAQLEVRQGMMLSQGQTLARINGLETVWIEAEVPESQAAHLQPGTPITATLAAWPNNPISGQISALVPELNRETRTLRVRAQIPNTQGHLRPGMYGRIELQSAEQNTPELLVPTEAVIATGRRYVVIVAAGNQRFTVAEVTIGKEQDNLTEIRSGLDEGERVVISGQFMIDSEASLRGALARMQNSSTVSHDSQPSSSSSSLSTIHEGTGTVKAIEEDEVTLDHDPISELKWPRMVMPFELAQPGMASHLSPGDHIRFTFIQKGDGPVIQSIDLQPSPSMHSHTGTTDGVAP